MDHKRDALDVSRHGRHFYLLVHNYKVKCLSFLEVHVDMFVACQDKSFDSSSRTLGMLRLPMDTNTILVYQEFEQQFYIP